MKKAIFILLCLAAGVATASVKINNVVAQQRYPWNGLVDIVVTLTGPSNDLSQTECIISATNTVTQETIEITRVECISSDIIREEVCVCHYVWDASEDIDGKALVQLSVEPKIGVQLWKDGPYWSEHNIGADRPEDSGYYFYWGGTEGYLRNEDNRWVMDDGSEDANPFDHDVFTYNIYPENLRYSGVINSMLCLNPKYDAARMYLGEDWRMPTCGEFWGLDAKCDWKWGKKGDVNGVEIRGKGEYSSKKIFLPASGVGNIGGVFSAYGEQGCYWSSSCCEGSILNSYSFAFYSTGQNMMTSRRHLGMPIRAVCENRCVTQGVDAEIDYNSEPRVAELREGLVYSSLWMTNSPNAVAEVAVNGTVIKRATGSGLVEWKPTRNGLYEVTHIVKINDVQVGETLSATFVVNGLKPENPVITPERGTIFDSSLTISMSCESEEATIHYTTDGSEPMLESPVYKRFRISEKTTVKARAFYEDGAGSEIVTAEYALGQCPDPVISTSGGETFYHKGNQVSIAYDCEEGVVRYTTDGSEPTKESPVYEGPFTTDESMVVKAKAFSDNYFDSAVVTATLTREWETVATPVITAADSFTGAKSKVEITSATEGATIRYTLNGSDPNSHAKKYTGPFYVTEGCTIKAYAVLDDYTNSEIAAKTITKVWGIGDSVALPDQTFTTSGDAEWVDASGEAMKSGTITDNQKSILSTTFVGKGVLSFKWKVSCEEDTEEHNWDHAAFFVDGVEIARQDGQTDWLDVTHTIEAEESHTVEWMYVKDEAEADGEDCMWVKDIIWMPERTQTSEVKVETTWLKTYFPMLGSYYFDYEEKANDTAANGINKIWEAYLIGLDPTDSAAKFVSSIAIEDGKPVVSWDPDLGGARAYTILGSTDLKTWNKVEEGRASDYNFFKVSVEMK